MISLDPQEREAGSVQPEDKKKHSALESMIVIAVVIAIMSIFIGNISSNYNSGQRHRRYTACQSNLKNIGTALEMYSTDNSGLYPPDLSYLTPGYISQIPACPEAGTNSVYISSYTMTTGPDIFTIYCSGKNHNLINIPENFPQYDSVKGLYARPSPRPTP